MGRAIGWVVIVGLVLVLGTHPGVMAGLVHELLAVLRGAGNELSSFVSRLLPPGNTTTEMTQSPGPRE